VVAGVASNGAELTGVLTSAAQRGFVGSVDPAGMRWSWAQVLGALDDPDDVAARSVTAAGGRIVVAGDFIGTGQTFAGTTLDATGARDLFVVELDESGAPIAARAFGGGGHTSGQAVSFDPTSSGVVVGGSFEQMLSIAGTELEGTADRTAYVAFLLP
jgi:hypothetical protein